MERPKKSSAVAGLPDDPLVEILSRVPVKALHRSKCVSKGWRDLIADPLHRKKLPQTLQGFFHAGNFINQVRGSPPPVDPSFRFLKNQPGIGYIWLMGSCNGLLLFTHYPPPKIGYIVCNPATEQWAAVPSEHTPADKHDFSRTYLLFDPVVSSHFQLVTFCSKEWGHTTVHTYSSKTGVWRHSQTDWAEEGRELAPQISNMVRGAVFFNGVLHVLLSRNQIAVLDLEGKTRGIIPVPLGRQSPSLVGRQRPLSMGMQSRQRPVFIGQSQGRLYCIVEELWADDTCSGLSIGVYARGFTDDRDRLSVWVLEDYGTQKWVLKQRVNRLRLFGSRFYKASHGYDVVGIHPDSNLLFISVYQMQQLISYSLDSKEVCALGTVEQDPLLFIPYVPCFLDFLSVAEHDEKLKGGGEPSTNDVARAGKCSGQ